MTGGPIPRREQELTPQALAELRRSLGLDRSLPQQYLSWLGGLAQIGVLNSLFLGTMSGSAAWVHRPSWKWMPRRLASSLMNRSESRLRARSASISTQTTS